MSDCYRVRENFKNGSIYGSALVLSLINMAYGLPVLLIYSWIRLSRPIVSLRYRFIVYLLCIKILWIVGVFFTFRHDSLFVLCQTLTVDVIILTALTITIDRGFLRGLSAPLLFLFILDLVFNVSIYLFGSDPFGRGGGVRPGDIIPRVGGLFGHPFYSVNISTVALFIGIYSRRRWALVLATLNLLINGTFRSPLTLIAVLIVYLLIKTRVKLLWMVMLLFLMSISVFLVTILSIADVGYFNGNALRVLAWINSIENILKNPVLGTHTFTSGSFEGMSADIIVDYGIAESTYLQYALDYGLIPMIAHLLIVTIIFQLKVRDVYNSPSSDRYAKAAAVLSGVVFVDTFYGTLLGSVLTTSFYGLLCISAVKNTSDVEVVPEAPIVVKPA